MEDLGEKEEARAGMSGRCSGGSKKRAESQAWEHFPPFCLWIHSLTPMDEEPRNHPAQGSIVYSSPKIPFHQYISGSRIMDGISAYWLE